MRPECKKAVLSAAKGAKVSDARMALIEEKMTSTLAQLAREDARQPNRVWQSLTLEQKYAAASTRILEDLKAEAAWKERNAELQVARAADADAEVKALMEGARKRSRTSAYVQMLDNVQNYAEQEVRKAYKELQDITTAVGDKEGVGMGRRIAMFLFNADNPAMSRDIMREIFKNADGHTGNKLAKLAAESWLKFSESARVRANAAGKRVGKLGYGYMQQVHSQAKLAAVKAADWAEYVRPLLDRTQYVDMNGSMLGDAEVTAMLVKAHGKLLGNTGEPGAFKGQPSAANRGADHRVIHFKDGEAWMSYAEKYGEGSMYDAIMNHVRMTTRDLALMERMGPNAAATHRVQADLAKMADAPAGVNTAKDFFKSKEWGFSPDTYFDVVSGNTSTPEGRWLAGKLAALRNIQTAGKIVWGPMTGFGDVVTTFHMLHFHKIPYLTQLSSLVGQTLSKAQRADLVSHEIVAESLVSDMNRFTADNVKNGITGDITNATMKLSLMNWWTNVGRNAFTASLMHNLGKTLAGKEFDKISQWDRAILERSGIGKAEWDIIKLADVKKHGGPREFLSATVIRQISDADIAKNTPWASSDDVARLRDSVATKWGAFLSDEAQFAVVNPDIRTRVIATGGTKAGTWTGEIARNFMQFKSFPMAMITRHWDRMLNTPQGLEGAPALYGGEGARSAMVNKIALATGFMISTTLAGAVQTQVRAVLSGKEPLPLDPSEEAGRKFWIKAVTAGGGASFLGDVLVSPLEDPGRTYQKQVGMLGPVPGAVIGGALDIATEAVKAKPGQKVAKTAATALKVGYDQLPFIDLWQYKLLTDRWVLGLAQENLNPGYGQRAEQRARKTEGTEYWWRPGHALPEFME